MKKFNVNEFIWFLILVLLEMEITYIIFTKESYEFITLESTNGLYLVLLTLPILIIVQAFKIFTFNSRKDNSANFLPIVLTLFLIIAFLIVA